MYATGKAGLYFSPAFFLFLDRFIYTQIELFFTQRILFAFVGAYCNTPMRSPIGCHSRK